METAEYLAFRTNLFEALWRDIAPLEEEIETNEHIPQDIVWKALREMTALGLLVPTEYGGAGLSVTQYLPIIAEFAKAHGGVRALVHVHNSFAHAVAELGTDDQRAELLPAVARGDASVAFALTEPDHGTGLDLGTTARLENGHYVIDGRKWLITNSNFASHFIVLARTGKAASDSLSAILVERDAPGLTIEALPETMGCKGGEHGRLTFENVRVPTDSILGGEPGKGEHQLEHALEISRLLVAGSSLGTAEQALSLSIDRSQSRVTFGRPIASRQAIQRYLAEMATDVYALRTMLQHAARKWDRGERIPAEASMCKLFGLEAVGRVTDRALLVFGGAGYIREHSIERLYRDARLNWIEEGTPTIQYLTAARALLDGHEWDEFAETDTPSARAS
ncbi:MAG: acyl-CoA dehydrogenase family protein [Actinobacteria bacterium]|nr:acyl-CoA dehydrogenase family protein [Actinomycetota bacterium]